MSEPTTPNRAYTIPNTGDLLNAWGPVINANFTAIDSNISAGVSVALTSGGTVTLSSAQAAHLAITLTGTLTGNAVLQVPQLGGFYFFNNTATGAYTVTVQTGAVGGSTVTLSTGWVLIYSDGTNAIAIAGGGQLTAPTGTIMLFQQTTAPTGWTKLTSNNDCALRVISGSVGTGGSIAFSTAFSASNTVDGHAISIAEMASHGHTVNDPGHSHTAHHQAGPDTITTSGPTRLYLTDGATSPATTGITLQNTGSGSAHDHTLSNLAVKYVDVIAAQRT